MIVIVDYGMGNVASVANMIRKVGGEAKLSASPDEVRRARKLILPGVGAFDAGVTALAERSLDHAVREAVGANGAVLLGICLGMQLLFESSEEGALPGLALLRGRVRRFAGTEPPVRVPHMGWNLARPVGETRLFANDSETPRYYFVHSYHAECADAGDVSAITTHGYDFACAVERENVMGVQFHPEKSHRYGMALFERFRAA